MSVTVREESQQFKDAYRRLAPSVAAALPSHITAARFERAAMVAVQRNPDLLHKVDRRSLFLAIQRAAADGLLPDGREGAIVSFGGQAQWMPMVAGLMKLARNSGEIANLSAHVAYEGEKFHVVLGDEERIEHELDLDAVDAGKILAVYAVATLKSGEKVREVMSRAQVEKVRAVSRAKEGGPWSKWYDQMALKTVIRRLAKRLPLSTDRDGDERFQRATESGDATVLNGEAASVDDSAPSAGIAAIEEKIEASEPAHDAETGELQKDEAPPDPERAKADKILADLASTTDEYVAPYAKSATVQAAMREWKKSRPELFLLVEKQFDARVKGSGK